MSIEASAPQAIIYDLTETVESTLLSTFSFRRSCWLRARPRVWEDGEGLFVRKGIKLNVVVLDLEEVDQKKKHEPHFAVHPTGGAVSCSFCSRMVVFAEKKEY